MRHQSAESGFPDLGAGRGSRHEALVLFWPVSVGLNPPPHRGSSRRWRTELARTSKRCRNSATPIPVAIDPGRPCLCRGLCGVRASEPDARLLVAGGSLRALYLVHKDSFLLLPRDPQDSRCVWPGPVRLMQIVHLLRAMHCTGRGADFAAAQAKPTACACCKTSKR
jgi:hypothetical protein